MKKQQFTAVLLIWLFSQQLLAAGWMTSSHVDIKCAEHRQSGCLVNMAEHKGHIMPVSESSASASMACDHCSVLCQPSLIVSDFSAFLSNSGHLPVTLYRPPILD